MEFVADQRERLDHFLARMLPQHSRSRLAAHIKSGGVRVDGDARKPGFTLEPGMGVTVDPIEERPPQDLSPVEMDLEVLYEDEWLMVVNKPAGLSTHPSPTSNEPTLVHALLARSEKLSRAGGEFRPGIVHRLDKDTSGLLLVAKTDAMHRALQKAIQDRKVERVYHAWVRGRPEQEEFTIRSYIGRHPRARKKMAVVLETAPGARLAVTHCRVLAGANQVASPPEKRKGAYTLLECRLETGRTHQIRVHLASVGLPIVGDQVYGVAHPGLSHQALHAAALRFDHPVTGERLELYAPSPFVNL